MSLASLTDFNASFVPSAMDLLLAVPRLAQRAGAFAFHIPESMDNLAGKIFNGGSIIADATVKETINSTITNTSNAFADITPSTLAQAYAAYREGGSTAVEENAATFLGGLTGGIRQFGNLGGVFSYLTSRWALATFTAAIFLNRANFYASSRQPLNPRWPVRLFLYGISIGLFTYQLVVVLQAMKCQTSPDFALLRYGDPLKNLAIDFNEKGGFLYKLSSTLLWWRDDAACCAAMKMSPVDDNRLEMLGSLSILWPFFVSLCVSQLVETMSCALQGRQPQSETGMTIFEHSLAFAECEAMISTALGFGFFGTPRAGSSENTMSSKGGSSEDTTIFMTKSMILRRLNMPPEVLLVCLITCFSHLSSAILAITGLRHRVRLINTGIWAISYMGAFLWTFLKIVLSPPENNEFGILRFPTVCIVGFIPHILLLAGIFVCALIYGMALLVTAMSVPEDVASQTTLRQRFAWAYQNLQANVQFSSSSSIRISMSEDFYTTLLKVGFNVLTAASEAVYLNEGSSVHVAQMTWLESKRLEEFASRSLRKTPTVPQELLGGGIARGVNHVDSLQSSVEVSGYEKERKSRPANSDAEKSRVGEVDNGLGLAERRSRMQMTFDFLAGIFWLVVSLFAQGVDSTLQRTGVERRPRWLLKAAGRISSRRRESVVRRPSKPEVHDFWMIKPDGSLVLPDGDDFDVEAETRRRLLYSGTSTNDNDVDANLYEWFTAGGRWGDIDTSGDYRNFDREDTTSMISMSTNNSNVDDEHDIPSSGQRTPTQSDPYAGGSRDSTPASLSKDENAMDLRHLAGLLNPQSMRDRDEARLLAHSLQTSRPMTRSQYRRDMNRNRVQILKGAPKPRRPRESDVSTDPDEEEAELERFILSRRDVVQRRAKNAGAGSSWDTGAEGMGEGGPQCVVCQSSPRTILVWPCGCLSMCDDCRVGLAARNYTKCICCRTDVAAYSRLYVP